MKNSDLLLVKTDVLPEVFIKVVEAKRLIASHKAKSASEAARMCGISRSAFYKYRDAVFSYNERVGGKIVNLSAVLEDRSGVLSTFIAVLGEMKVNILTINQGMPSDGVAQVTVSCQDDSNIVTDEIIRRLSSLDGVVTLHQVLGEI